MLDYVGANQYFYAKTKEIQSFFANLTGYLVIGVFLLSSGLFLFVFNEGYNILDSGFADLKPFFDLISLVFIIY